MIVFYRHALPRAYRILVLYFLIFAFATGAPAQTLKDAIVVSRSESSNKSVVADSAPARLVTPGFTPFPSAVPLYFDPLQGASSNDLVQRALTSNGELSATRLDIERGRARLRQVGLRPNPTIDFERARTIGRLTGRARDKHRGCRATGIRWTTPPKDRVGPSRTRGC
jgi:hypothetical protein